MNGRRRCPEGRLAPETGSAAAPERVCRARNRVSAAPAAFSELEQGLPLVTGDELLDRAAVSPGFLSVLRSRDVLLQGLAAMFLCVIEFSALAQLVLFLKGDWGYTAVAAGGLLAFCQGLGAIGKPVSGLVSDRVLGGRRRPALIALAGLAGAACAILALIRPGQTLALWLALALLGVGAVGWGGLWAPSPARPPARPPPAPPPASRRRSTTSASSSGRRSSVGSSIAPERMPRPGGRWSARPCLRSSCSSSCASRHCPAPRPDADGWLELGEHRVPGGVARRVV